MTIKEIIESINFNLWCGSDEIPTTQEDLIVIKEALEKREKKELKTQTVNRGIDVSGEYDIDYDYLCPCCEAVVGNYETEYYNTVYDSLGSQTEAMYESGYDMSDIREQEIFEKFLREKSDILESECLKRNIKLWENKK